VNCRLGIDEELVALLGLHSPVCTVTWCISLSSSSVFVFWLFFNKDQYPLFSHWLHQKKNEKKICTLFGEQILCSKVNQTLCTSCSTVFSCLILLNLNASRNEIQLLTFYSSGVQLYIIFKVVLCHVYSTCASNLSWLCRSQQHTPEVCRQWTTWRG
jgi:hypothetical protein